LGFACPIGISASTLVPFLKQSFGFLGQKIAVKHLKLREIFYEISMKTILGVRFSSVLGCASLGQASKNVPLAMHLHSKRCRDGAQDSSLILRREGQ